MDCQELTRVIVASATFLSLSQPASAEESRSDNRGPLTPITSVEQAQAIADFGVGYFPQYASMHESYFVDTASTIAMEVTAALNAEPAVFPTQTNMPFAIRSSDVEQEQRKEEDRRRIAKSLADGMKRAQAYQFRADLTVSCRHSGYYTIANVSRQGANDSDGSRSVDLLVNYVNCVDEYSAESYSIERNGPVQVSIFPMADGKFVTNRIALGNSSDGTDYVVSYTHVATQKLVSRWSANFSVAGSFLATRYSDFGVPLGKFAYVIDGKVHEWYIVRYSNQDYEVDFDLAADSVSILRRNRISAGVDGLPDTDDDIFRADANYRRGSFKLSLVGSPGDTQPVNLMYTFDDIRYREKRNIANGNRLLSVDGGFTYSFPYFANPVCTSGAYEFNSINSLQYDNNFSSLYPIAGNQILSRSALIEYGQDLNSDLVMTVLLNGQSGTFNLTQDGIQKCF